MVPRSHNLTITIAARRHLAPLDLQQKGRSRFWYDDRKWYLIGVEFQPSSWAKGSYLNVGCCFLWNPKEYFSYDLGGRAEGFQEFNASSDWGLVSDGLARRAAELVHQYRSEVPSIAALADYYDRHTPDDFWRKYHAAVASGLTGRTASARQWFTELINEPAPPDYQWLTNAINVCRELNDRLGNQIAFRAQVEEQILKCRVQQRLPHFPRPLSEMGAA